MTERAQTAQTDPNAERPAATGPLAGLRVLDLTRILAGPTATQLLGDLGAEIYKIERPGSGDDTRAWGPPFVKDAEGRDTRESAYYMSSNRNKRSIAVDISQPAGAELVRAMAGKCDILMENYKVGGLKKYGLAYDDLRPAHPRLIYCSITGFGQTGPNKHRAGYDLLAQGVGGIMSLTGEPDGQPMKVGVGVADVVCGLYAVSGVLAALRWRDQTGEGQHIDIALLDAQIAWLINEGVNYLTSGEVPQRRGNAHPNIAPYQVYEAADGHVIVAVGNDAQFARFAALLGAPALAADPRFAANSARITHRDALNDALVPLIRQQSRAALLSAMEREGVPGDGINRLDEVFASEQVAARGMKISLPHPLAASGAVDLIGNPLKLSRTPVNYRNAPPVCGADAGPVLTELFEGDDETAALAAKARDAGALS